ncbi:MAG TPA: amidase family protein [Acetobacteraceae bacterium]|nr:amidase family protein [Acetobacteraceae bacterium]
MPATDAALLTAEEMLALYARRLLSPVEVLQAVTERIAQFNPTLNAFAVLNPRALEAAGESEMRWRIGRPLGPLDGVPCTVKDLVDVAGFPTRRGSRTSDPNPVADDAPAVVGLKAAGAVIVGKTTTTEYGWKSPGDCPLNGITRNAWNPAHTTGGSSSGAGAAGAAGFGSLHIGTDAGGSIRIPAAWSGLVGLKPTLGRVPMWPASAFPGVSVLGPMTRTVRDAAMMFAAMAHYDVRDPYCVPDEGRDWLAGIEDGVAGLRIGVLRSPGFDAPVDKDGIAAVERAASLLAEAGAIVDEAAPSLPDTREVFSRVWGATLSRIVANTPQQQRDWLDPGLLEVARTLGNMSAIEYLDAEATRSATAHEMARLHQSFDLVLCPTVPGPPPLADAPLTDPVRALWTEWAPWTFTFNITRQPAISMPLGQRANGLPNAVQVAAAQYRDDLVLRAARVLEQAVPVPVADLSGS